MTAQNAESAVDGRICYTGCCMVSLASATCYCEQGIVHLCDSQMPASTGVAVKHV